MQQVRFGTQVVEHVAVHRGAADDVSNLPLDVDGLGEGAEVQTNDGVFQPALYRRDMKGGGVCVQVDGIGGGIQQDEIGGVVRHGVRAGKRQRAV